VNYLADVAALARKDLLLELRARDTLPAMLLFVLATLVAFRFAVPEDSERASIGLLWVAILFTALVGITRAFIPEREQGVLDALVLAPVDRSAIWAAKVIATLAFLLAAEVVALPAYALFFEGLTWQTAAAIALADLGICAVGAIVAAMAAGGRARELLFPLLFLPLALPLLLGGVGAGVADDPGRYLAFLGLYDALFAILAWASFEYVVTE
jgi:heme exporter protein B